MEHLLISTPPTEFPVHRVLFQPEGKADLRAEVLAATPCFISLSSHPPRLLNATGRLDERKNCRQKFETWFFAFRDSEFYFARFAAKARSAGLQTLSLRASRTARPYWKRLNSTQKHSL
jgi:hypothetical protein